MRARRWPVTLVALSLVLALGAPPLASTAAAQTVDDIINHTCGRLLDMFGIETKAVKRWQGGPVEEE